MRFKVRYQKQPDSRKLLSITNILDKLHPIVLNKKEQEYNALMIQSKVLVKIQGYNDTIIFIYKI